MSGFLLNRVFRLAATGRRPLLVLVLSTALALISRRSEGQSMIPVAAERVTLREVFDSVRSNNPLLGAANARARAARGGLTTARTWSNPVVSFESQQMSEPGLGTGASQRETMTTAMLPLEPFYQRGPRIQRAQALIRASEADVLTQRQQVAIEAADTYYQVALAQVNVAATRSLAQWFDTVVTYNAVRVREGVTAEADLIRSELERDHVLNELAMAESELAQAEADIQTFIRGGRDAAGVQVDVDSVPLVASRIITTTVRPEVEAARQRVVASEAAAAGEKRLFLRELGAMVGTKTMGGSSSLVTGFTVPFPLLDQNRGSIDAARADRDAAKFDLEFEQRRADADRLGAEKAARILSQRVAAFGSGPRGYLARAEESRRIALGAYREGGANAVRTTSSSDPVNGRSWRRHPRRVARESARS